MIADSSVWAAQLALVEAIKTNLTGVRVDYGTPLDTELRPEHVFVSARAEGWSFDHPQTNLAADESFSLVVGLFVVRAGDQVAVVNRMKEIAAGVEKAVTDDYTLGGAVDLAYIKGARLMDGRDDSKRQLAIELDIACTSQANG